MRGSSFATISPSTHLLNPIYIPTGVLLYARVWEVYEILNSMGIEFSFSLKTPTFSWKSPGPICNSTSVFIYDFYPFELFRWLSKLVKHNSNRRNCNWKRTIAFLLGYYCYLFLTLIGKLIKSTVLVTEENDNEKKRQLGIYERRVLHLNRERNSSTRQFLIHAVRLFLYKSPREKFH